MRFILLAIMLFVTCVGNGVSNTVYADVGGHICAHEHANNSGDDYSDISYDPLFQSEKEGGHCFDCCCAHFHSIVVPSTSIQLPLAIRQYVADLSYDHYSAELSGVKRPPRL